MANTHFLAGGFTGILPAMRNRILVLLVIGVAVLVGGCTGRSFVDDFTVSPQTIAPVSAGLTTHATISFKLKADAEISLALVDAQGNRIYLRQDTALKARRNAYTIVFNGVAPVNSVSDGDVTILARMLPEGEYTVELTAFTETGAEHTSRTNLILDLPDQGVPLPEIVDLRIKPNRLTPNEDGEDDLLDVSFDLVQDVASLDVYLENYDGSKAYRITEVEGTNEPLMVGPHQFTYNIATAPGVISEDGDYIIRITTVDDWSQSMQVTRPLQILQSGRPHAFIVDAKVTYSTDVIAPGDTLCFDLSVLNDSETYVRTSGPEPGTTYRSDQNFATLSGAEDPGAFRVVMDYEDSKTNYPYRWAVGTQGDELIEMDGGWYLSPGEIAHVYGCVTFIEGFKADQYVWMGLIHEQGRVPYINHRVAPQLITAQPEE